MTITSSEHSRIFSQGTLKLNDSLNTGFSVQLKMGVFRFSTRFSPNCSHTFTYGSINKCKIISSILRMIASALITSINSHNNSLERGGRETHTASTHDKRVHKKTTHHHHPSLVPHRISKSADATPTGSSVTPDLSKCFCILLSHVIYGLPPFASPSKSCARTTNYCPTELLLNLMDFLLS